MRTIYRVTIGWVLGLFVLVNPTGALTVEKISLERMTNESAFVVYGRVISSYSQWEGRSIYTYTTVRVNESIKGDAGSFVSVKQLGGKVGDVGLDVPGSPELKTGEDVILFLTRWQDQNWIHSIALGKFTITNEDGTPVAYNDLNNIGLVDPVTGREVTEPNLKKNHFPLQNFLNEVRSYTRN